MSILSCSCSLRLYSCLEHPNLVRLFGVALHPIRLVLEFVRGSDLYQRMHTPPPNLTPRYPPGTWRIPAQEFPWPVRLRIALDIATAMAHLESMNPPIIHRYSSCTLPQQRLVSSCIVRYSSTCLMMDAQ